MVGEQLLSGRDEPVEPRAGVGFGGQVLLPDGAEDEVEGGFAGLDHARGRPHGQVADLTDQPRGRKDPGPSRNSSLWAELAN